MTDPVQAQDFLVDFGFDESETIRAEYAGILDGALCFLDKDSNMIEFFGSGYWKRVRVKDAKL